MVFLYPSTSLCWPSTVHLDHGFEELWPKWFRIIARAGASAIKHPIRKGSLRPFTLIPPSSMTWFISVMNESKKSCAFKGLRHPLKSPTILLGILKILNWCGQNVHSLALSKLPPSVLKSISTYSGNLFSGIICNFLKRPSLNPRCRYSPPDISWMNEVAIKVGVPSTVILSLGRNSRNGFSLKVFKRIFPCLYVNPALKKAFLIFLLLTAATSSSTTYC